MLLKKETKEIQSQLANYCRDGELLEIKGATTSRLHHYRRLVYNVINQTLQQAYPITNTILSNDQWASLIQDFFTQHDSQSNQVWKMPYELYEFAKTNAYHKKLEKPFLLELLYFEWIEIEVYCMPDKKAPSFSEEGNVEENNLIVVNPDAILSHFTYPVHRKGWKELESNMGNYYILSFREHESGKVKFIELSSLFVLVFEHLREQVSSARTALIQAGKSLGVENEKLLLEKGIPFLNELKKQGAILGFSK